MAAWVEGVLRTEESGEEREWKGVPMGWPGQEADLGLHRGHSDVLYIRDCHLYCLRYGVQTEMLLDLWSRGEHTLSLQNSVAGFYH